MLKGLHITHNDADAVGAVIAANFIPDVEWDNSYNDVRGASDSVESLFFESDVKYDILLISDIFITEEIADKIEEYRASHHDFKVYLIDHHRTNKLGDKYPWAHVIIEENGVLVSAAYNVLKFFKEEIMQGAADNGVAYSVLEYVINSISRYDTWEWKKHPRTNPNEDEFMIMTKYLDLADVAEQVICNIKNSSVEYEWDIFSEVLIQIYRKKCERVINNTLDNTVITQLKLADAEYKCALIIADDTYGNAQLSYINENTDVNLSIGIYPQTRTLSLRSLDETDVGKIATYYGGGGHMHAAGIRPTVDFYLNIMRTYYENKK